MIASCKKCGTQAQIESRFSAWDCPFCGRTNFPNGKVGPSRAARDARGIATNILIMLAVGLAFLFVLAAMTGHMTGTLAVMFLGYIYVAPTLFARTRKHSRFRMIASVNLLLGWTLIGWIVAVAWAFTEDNRHESEKAADVF